MVTQTLRRHGWAAARWLLLAALLHRLNILAFLAASSPVLLLTAFLLGAVLVHSDGPLAGAGDEDPHLYKKMRRVPTPQASSSDEDNGSSATGSGGGASSGSSSSSSGVEEDRFGCYGDGEEVGKAAVAWTADDEHSIRSIGSLELERDARLEKLMSRRSIHRNLIDLDINLPAVALAARNKKGSGGNPFDHDDGDFPGSAPSLLGRRGNPFDLPLQEESAATLTRHESFTGGGPAAVARPASRFRPYFVADGKAIQEGSGGGDGGSYKSSPSSSTSSTPSAAIGHHSQQQSPVVNVATSAAPPPLPPPSSGWDGDGSRMAVDVELISDSSDDDMSLPGGGDAAIRVTAEVAPEQSDDDDAFEVESITQQVAAGQQKLLHRHQTISSGAASTSPSGQHHQPQHEKEEATISSKEIWVAPSTLASVEDNEREREVSEIREHHILGPVPIDSSSSTSAGADADVAAASASASDDASAGAGAEADAGATDDASAGAGAEADAGDAVVAAPEAAPPPAVAAKSGGKSGSKSKVPSKKVFGFFRK